MTSLNHKITTGFIVTLTATVAMVSSPQPASAQILEAVGGALNAIIGGKKQPAPPVIQRVPVPVQTAPNGPEFNVGTNNANGNSLNLCVSNCTPDGQGAAPVSPQVVPQATAPRPVPVGAPRSVPAVAPQPKPVTTPTAQPGNSVQQQSSSTSIQQQSSTSSTPNAQTSVQQSTQSATAQNVPAGAIPNIPQVNTPSVPNVPGVPVNLPR